ncbi:SHOCT domain-containing protein [Herbidospora yilanensis]|uniref:SHOCT domain-containing protein n=1 Tax=Herbidospora yilanensis TaxID=354426 RepID=UPI000780A9AA|nr:hypothetical protein [Herbidospora yilanensis]
MMYGYGIGMGWMIIFSLVWLVLLGAVVWAAIRLAQGWGGKERAQEPADTPEEILARRFARGEIDEPTYDAARERLSVRRSR